MQLLGSIILRNLLLSTVLKGSLLSTLDSLLLCLYHNLWHGFFQDGIIHKKNRQISVKMRIDRVIRLVI